MQIKGTAVASIVPFIQKKFPDRYYEWLQALTPKSRGIFEGVLLASSWYPLQEALIEPTEKMCELFFGGSDQGAWAGGEFSAEHGLKGVLKFFIKAGSPQFIIKRATAIFTSYYRPGKIEVLDTSASHARLKISEFTECNTLIECRIAGWMRQALRICGCSDPDVQIEQSAASGADHTIIACSW
ncbi:hypothetical protein JXO52_09290 [bacterium]|nr:hypothetical protein [bacterium]